MNKKEEKDKRHKVTREEFEELKKEIMELRQFYKDNNLDNRGMQYIGILFGEKIEPTEEFLEVSRLLLIYEDAILDINKRFQNYDLSKIPFKAYEDFYNLGFNFEGTKANINFKIMQDPDEIFMDGLHPKLKYKSCNLRNLKMIKHKLFNARDNSFDRKIVEENFELFKDHKGITYIDEIKEKLANKEKEKKNINENFIPEAEKNEIIKNLETLGLNKESNIIKHEKNPKESDKEDKKYKEDKEKSTLDDDEREI